MKWTLESKLPAGFMLAVAVLCATGVASYRSTQEFAEAGKAVARSQEVLRELESTLLAVKEAEAHQLAFVASGNERMQPASRWASTINAKFKRLKELTAGANGRSAESAGIRTSCRARGRVAPTTQRFSRGERDADHRRGGRLEHCFLPNQPHSNQRSGHC